MLTEREKQAVANMNAALDKEDDNGWAWTECGEADAPVVLAALRRLSHTTATTDAPGESAPMGEVEKRQLQYWAALSPADLLNHWLTAEEESHVEPGSYKVEWVKLLLNALAAVLSATPAPVAAGGWVPVGERLPEVHKYLAHGWFEQYSSDLVLAYEAGEKRPHLYYCDEKGRWRMSGVEFHGHYAQVTHWQPLPATPSQEQEVANG